MNCDCCGRDVAVLVEYGSGVVGKHIVLRKAGERFKYQLDFYSRAEVRGAPAFALMKGNRMKMLTPDVVSFYGDAHAYWIVPGTHKEVTFCTRRCAVQFAATNDRILLRKRDGLVIAPQQEQFDAYARKHDLKHCLALMEDDDWTTPEAELKGLLQARLQTPKRLIALASAMIDEGRLTLAENAVQKVISEFPIHVSAQHCASVLSRLGRSDRIDALYEQFAKYAGGREKLPGEVLSTWAFGIAGHDRRKAVELSKHAVMTSPTSLPVVENHLMLLAMGDTAEALVFFRDHSAILATDVGFYAAGQAFLHSGRLSEAEEHLQLADTLVPDPMSKAYLAEVLYRLGRYAEAQRVCRDGRLLLEAFEIRAASDFDGGIRTPSHYPYEQKKGLRKAFLSIEGKCLIAIGEEVAGRQRIQDSLDINLGFVSKDVFYEQLESYVTEYPTREKLQVELAEEQRRVGDILNRKQKSEAVAERLGDIIQAIASTHQSWHESLENIRESASTDLLSEHFASKIHAFSILLRNEQRSRYSSLREMKRAEFAGLPDRAIEQLANAEFLLERLDDDSLPVFAAVIIEFCKALETAVNEIVVSPFARSKSSAFIGGQMDVILPNGRTGRLEVTFQGRPKSLMAGELVLLLSCTNQEWAEFAEQSLGPRANWFRRELPEIIKKVKDKFRNGSAHHSSATRAKATELHEYLKTSSVFSVLSQIGIQQRPVGASA